MLFGSLIKGAWSTTKGITKNASWAAGSAAKTGWSLGKFAYRHPYITAGAVGTGVYIANASPSPYESPTQAGDLEGIRLSATFNQEQAAAQTMNESGIAPAGNITSGAAVRNQRLMESTMGLGFGLHRGRH